MDSILVNHGKISKYGFAVDKEIRITVTQDSSVKLNTFKETQFPFASQDIYLGRLNRYN